MDNDTKFFSVVQGNPHLYVGKQLSGEDCRAQEKFSRVSQANTVFAKQTNTASESSQTLSSVTRSIVLQSVCTMVVILVCRHLRLMFTELTSGNSRVTDWMLFPVTCFTLDHRSLVSLIGIDCEKNLTFSAIIILCFRSVRDWAFSTLPAS